MKPKSMLIIIILITIIIIKILIIVIMIIIVITIIMIITIIAIIIGVCLKFAHKPKLLKSQFETNHPILFFSV